MIIVENLQSTLDSLKPRHDPKVIDLVRDAGVNVLPWGVKKDGSPVARPETNPAYCYEWVFGGGDQSTVLCVWQPDVRIADGRICFEDNLRAWASKLDQVANDRSSPPEVVSRSRGQAVRSRKFDLAVQRAAFRKQPVRIIFLIGDDAGANKIGWDTSRVRYRSLDSEPWSIEYYDMDSGDFRLVRGRPTVSVVVEEVPEDETPGFVDQFSIPPPAQRIAVETTALPRSPEVRCKVLERAQGNCECCGEAGFRMANGAIYLETHHVIPLGEGGPDVEWNVVAICPNDHRRAHFAVERDELSEQLISTLTITYPKARDALISLRAPT